MVCMMIISEALAPAANAAAAQIDPTSEGEAFVKQLRLIASPSTLFRYSGPNLVDQPVIDAIRQLAQSEAFSSGIYHECSPQSVRSELNALLAANGLEEVPTEGA